MSWPEVSFSEVLYVNVIHRRLEESGAAEIFFPAATESLMVFFPCDAVFVVRLPGVRCVPPFGLLD